MGGNIVWNMEDSLLSGSEIGVVEKKLSCEKANFHIFNGNADQSKLMAWPVIGFELCNLLRC